MPLNFSNILGAQDMAKVSQIIEDNARKGVRPVAREVREQLKDLFPTGSVIYSDGSKHRLADYSEMVVATSLLDAEREAVLAFIKSNPTDLVEVSVNGSVHPGCAMWEGEILSVSGLNPHFRPLDAAIGPGLLFHPRCQHTIHPVYNDGLSSEEGMRQDNMRAILDNQVKTAELFSSPAKAGDFIESQQSLLAPRFTEEFEFQETPDGVFLRSTLRLVSTDETVSTRRKVTFSKEDEITDAELERISGTRTSVSLI